MSAQPACTALVTGRHRLPHDEVDCPRCNPTRARAAARSPKPASAVRTPRLPIVERESEPAGPDEEVIDGVVVRPLVDGHGGFTLVFADSGKLAFRSVASNFRAGGGRYPTREAAEKFAREKYAFLFDIAKRTTPIRSRYEEICEFCLRRMFPDGTGSLVCPVCHYTVDMRRIR